MAITIGGKTPQSINIGGKDVQSLAINGEIVWSKAIEGFYLEALVASAKFTITRRSSQSQGITLQYSVDGGETWTNVTYIGNVFTRTLSSAGDKIYLRSTDGFHLKINCDKQYSAGGDLKCLVDYNADGKVEALGSNFSTMFESGTNLVDISNLSFDNISLLGTYSCDLMFYGCTGLTDISSLALPDIKSGTTDNCNGMFQRCTNITNLPRRMPQNDTLGENAFFQMFLQCSSITSIPSNLLPATTVGKNCYSRMFQQSGVISIPSGLLPATTLGESCYLQMFDSCASLTTVPLDLLPATTAAVSCYSNMFHNCTALVNAPTINLTALANTCCGSMFNGCSALVTGPEIKTTTLSGTNPFGSMFSNCTKISWVKFHATNWGTSATSYTNYWFDGAKNTSACKFYLPSSAPTPSRGTSGVPSNWSIERF